MSMTLLALDQAAACLQLRRETLSRWRTGARKRMLGSDLDGGYTHA